MRSKEVTAVGKDKNDDTIDGGKHDVGRDGQTGKTSDDIDPKDYEQGSN